MRHLIKAMIRLAQKTRTTDTTTNFPAAQASWLGKSGNFIVWQPYGTFGNAPVDSYTLLINLMGQEENRIGLETALASEVAGPMVQALEGGLVEGEYLIGNVVTGAYQKFRQDGVIEINSPAGLEIDITGPAEITASGDVTINCASASVTASGDVDVSATNCNLDAKCNLGSGGPAIARLGDAVQVTVASGSSAGNWTGTITAGSGNHTAD